MNIDKQSQYLPESDLIRFDETTGETTNRGTPVDAPSNTHRVRQAQENEWEEYCYYANVKIHGREKADALRKFAMEGDV